MEDCLNEFFLYEDEIKSKNEFIKSVTNNGKSIYEVIRIIEGKPLFLKEHLKRMDNSFKITNFKMWITEEEIKNRIKKLVEVNKVREGNIKIIFNFYNTNTFLAYFSQHYYPPLEYYKVGVDTIFFHGERKQPNAKVINTEFREKVNKKIKESDVFEAILVDNNGNITEGSKSNIFMIREKKVITAPIEDILPGVTRNMVMKICNSIGLEIIEQKVNYREIDKFDALFISGTSPKVLPIKKVGDVRFYSSENKVLINIMEGYDYEVQKDIANFRYY